MLLIFKKSLPEITVIMYVDDLLIYRPCAHSDALVLVRSTVLKVQIFRSFSGLQMILGKSRILLKNLPSPPYAGVGLRVVSEFKYLGVLLGHVSVDHVYASVVATTFQRAKFLAQLPLHLQERNELLKVWILSLFEFPARVYLPTQLVISQLRNICCLALGLDSWGMLLPFIAQPLDQGGYGLVMPHTYLYWQNALAFVSHLTGNVCLPPIVVAPLEQWCAVVGFVPRLQFLFLL